MLHSLPAETYPMGMLNVEVSGPGSATGTFVTPAEDTTLNTHCSLPQHEQKGCTCQSSSATAATAVATTDRRA